VLGVALTLILGIGIWRWLKESFLNIKLGKHDQTYDPDRNDPWKKKYWERLNRMFNGQAWTGTAMLPLLGIPVLTGLYLDFARAAALPPDISLLPGRGWYSALAAGTGILVAAILQTTVNWLGGRSKAEADTASREAPEPESV
jgi:hypothetical protein